MAPGRDSCAAEGVSEQGGGAEWPAGDSEIGSVSEVYMGPEDSAVQPCLDEEVTS